MKKCSLFYVDLLLLGVAFVWGINPVIVKIGLKYIPSQSFNFTRMLFASLFSWIILYKSKSYVKMNKKDFTQIVLMSIFGYFLYQMSFIVGITYTSAGNTSLILSMVPISVCIINKIFNIEQIKKNHIVGIMLSVIGVIFIVFNQSNGVNFSVRDLIGICILIIGLFACGYYTVFSKKLLVRYSNYQIITYLINISTVLFFIFSFKSIITTNWNKVILPGWITSLFSGIFAICIGNFIWIWGVKKVGSVRTSVYNNVSPVFAIITSYIFLGETFGMLKFIGVILIFVGVYITGNDKS